MGTPPDGMGSAVVALLVIAIVAIGLVALGGYGLVSLLTD